LANSFILSCRIEDHGHQLDENEVNTLNNVMDRRVVPLLATTCNQDVHNRPCEISFGRRGILHRCM